ncbi:uncharacterized protein PHACADRAFT_188274 [Phanerochaete carnosa HHB-10118-sp]|uniref:Uncharacterized protein n=1 Tax=Phanerochaete carnosa (strain HHB-10118-sp) TaxID=650164 RepID=K5VVE7_PHACS|nr:uncharacterized protein PHACADRAFT_188274 [Phanerochaete carnosa HHB-10118-sp]EKM50775.1 hypothetical protein PHACADRAFT_188274 [Phanerochaete carnosa HHB-10118-sp]
MSTYLPASTPTSTSTLSGIVRCVDAFGISAETTEPLSGALFSVEGSTSSMKAAIIAAVIGAGTSALLVVLLVLVVVLLRRTKAKKVALGKQNDISYAYLSDNSLDVEKGATQDDKDDSVIDISAHSSPVEPEESGTRWLHALPSPRTSVRHSQPPPYRSRQGSAATTNGHTTVTPSPLTHTDVPPAELTRRPSQMGIDVRFHRPFNVRSHVPPSKVSLSPLEVAVTPEPADRLPDDTPDPRSPLDPSLLDPSLEFTELWLGYEQDIADHSRGHRSYSSTAVTSYFSH